MTLSQCIWPIQGRFAYRRAGGKETFLPPNRCDSAHNLLGLPGPDPGHFLLVQKVTNTHPEHLNTHRGGTLSMGSLPYVPLPRDDTKGGARPPLDSPAGPVLVLVNEGNSRGCWMNIIGSQVSPLRPSML